MDYFEVRDRLNQLKVFRRLYKDFLGFTNRDRNPAAQLVLEKLEPMARQTVDSLRRVRLGSLVTRDAPSRGGKRVRINIVKAIFRNRVKRHYSLDDSAPLEVLDKGILIYQRRLWAQTVQLFNPVFWLYHFFGYIARLPILIFQKAGFETEAAEKTLALRIWVAVVQVICFWIVLEWCGIWSRAVAILMSPGWGS